MALKAGRLADSVTELDERQWRDFFDEQARTLLGMSWDDFVREYKAGRWPDPDADPHVMYLVSLLPAT